MSASPIVSIIIPCFNAEPWIAATLDSALAQTWVAKEIILVDDGSRDRSLAIAHTYATRGVTVIAQSNHGAAAARNRGLTAARGDYIQFLDADDLLAPDKIERQLAHASVANPLTLLSAKWGRFERDLNEVCFRNEALNCSTTPVDWVVSKMERNAMMHPAAWLVSRELVRRAGPWDERLTLDDDGEFFTRVVLQSDFVRYCDAAVSYYRSNLPASLSQRTSETAWTSALLAIELSIEKLLAREDSPRTRHAAASALQRFLYESYPSAAAHRPRVQARVRALGGTSLQPEGGGRFQLARRLIGWRLAKRLGTHR